MEQQFEVTAKVTRPHKAKAVSEKYLVDALSLTEAEARMFEYLEATVQSGFYCQSARRVNFISMYPSGEGGRWIKVKGELPGEGEKTSTASCLIECKEIDDIMQLVSEYEPFMEVAAVSDPGYEDYIKYKINEND